MPATTATPKFFSILAMREITNPEEGTTTLKLCSKLNPYFSDILAKSGKLQNAVKLKPAVAGI